MIQPQMKATIYETYTKHMVPFDISYSLHSHTQEDNVRAQTIFNTLLEE